MTTYTEIDISNAHIYAYYKIVNDRLKEFVKINPYFNSNNTVERIVDYQLPDQGEFNGKLFVNEYSFTKQGCENISCFPFRQDGKMCTKPDLHLFFDGNDYNDPQFSCQEACFNIIPNNDKQASIMLETSWKNDKCVLENSMLKMYCLRPDLRKDNKKTKDCPPFIWKPDEGMCEMTEEYCEYFGFDWDQDKRDCYKTGGQVIAENIFGQTLIGAIKKKHNAAYPKKRRGKRSTKEIQQYIESYWNPDVFDKKKQRDIDVIAARIGIDLLVDWGIVSAVDLGKTITIKTANLFVGKNANKIGSFLFKHGKSKALVKLGLKTMTRFMAKSVAVNLSIKAFTKAVSLLAGAATGVFNILQIVSMVIDFIDPSGYSEVVDKEYLENLCLTSWYSMNTLFNYDGTVPVEITPELVMNILLPQVTSDPSTEELITYTNYFLDYMKGLQVNSNGQLLTHNIYEVLTLTDVKDIMNQYRIDLLQMQEAEIFTYYEDIIDYEKEDFILGVSHFCLSVTIVAVLPFIKSKNVILFLLIIWLVFLFLWVYKSTWWSS